VGTRSEELARQFEQTNNDVVAAVESCPDAQWRATTAEEGWTVAATAHHVAAGCGQIVGLAQAIATGQPLPPITMEMVNAGNAQHAQQFATCAKQETVDLLKSGGASAAGAVRALSDEQLDRTAPFMGNTASAQWVIENILIGHPQNHLQSIKHAVGV
jgi:uncharacterized damage-inducible protein DinB